MPRRPIVQSNLRISPDLHRRLEQAAKRNRNSLNREMAERLAESFVPKTTISAINLDAAINTIVRVSGEIEAAWSNLDAEHFRMQLQQNLVGAAAALVEEHSPENVERVRKAIAAVTDYASRLETAADGP